MIRLHRRPLFFGKLAVAFFWLEICVHAQVPTVSNKELQQAGLYLGPLSCASSTCHGSVKPRTAFDVKQNEYFVWAKQDKHSRAYEVLLNERSLLIARNLKLKEKPSESAECLSCHSLYVEKGKQARPVDVRRGVSCEACHGPATGWIAKHMEDGWSHEMSVKAGMADLRSLANRAAVCLGCHLGDDHRTVNHELIAAGHPNLVFELDNYTAAMPPHWTSFKDRRVTEGREQTDGARAWFVGQAVAFRAGLVQLAKRARSERWPEFAEMNCYACHHSLKGPNQHQVRAPLSRLGLPSWSHARFAMWRHLVSVFAPEKRDEVFAEVATLSGYIAKINTSGKIVAEAASRMAETSTGIIQKIARGQINDDTARKLVSIIAKEIRDLKSSDMEFAKQAAMTMNSLAHSTMREKSERDAKIAQAIDRLYQDVSSYERFNWGQFSKHLTELEALTRLAK